MRALIQRVSSASVTVDGVITGQIANGLLVLLGVSKTDTAPDATALAQKIIQLRIFPDEAGKMNLDIQAAAGALLVVSQFTLYGDCKKGRRPGFDQAAPAELARELYEHFVSSCKMHGIAVQTGVFQAHMDVALVNDGPVTFMVEVP